jgi:hypothetical protein
MSDMNASNESVDKPDEDKILFDLLNSLEGSNKEIYCAPTIPEGMREIKVKNHVDEALEVSLSEFNNLLTETDLILIHEERVKLSEVIVPDVFSDIESNPFKLKIFLSVAGLTEEQYDSVKSEITEYNKNLSNIDFNNPCRIIYYLQYRGIWFSYYKLNSDIPDLSNRTKKALEFANSAVFVAGGDL